jgi:hypothetical protein
MIGHLVGDVKTTKVGWEHIHILVKGYSQIFYAYIWQQGRRKPNRYRISKAYHVQIVTDQLWRFLPRFRHKIFSL